MSEGRRLIQTKLSFSQPEPCVSEETPLAFVKKRRLSADWNASSSMSGMKQAESTQGKQGPSRGTDNKSNPGQDKEQESDQAEPVGEQQDFELSDGSHHPLPETDESEEEIWVDTEPERQKFFSSKKKIESQKPQETAWNDSKLRTAPSCYKGQENLLKPDATTQVMFSVQGKVWADKPLQPYPMTLQDKWDDKYVYMPCSPLSKIPDLTADDGTRSRWEAIEEALTSTMTSSFDIADTILSFNSHYRRKWDFWNLHCLFDEDIKDEQRLEFFQETLPKMTNLACRLPLLCTKPIPILDQFRKRKLVMSQHQAACLLANAFFCTFPRRNMKLKGKLPDINFSNLFNGPRNGRKMEKLKCILNYFRRVTKEMPNGVVSFERRSLDSHPIDWDQVKKRFTDLQVTTDGTIEDDGIGMLQADFANKYVGGGVLGRGCVQEEIRFIICPEMILSRLFTQVLTDKEVLVMTGCERFSDYKGYADTFRYGGDYVDNTVRDSWGRRCTEVVAMDALVVRQFMDQFAKDKVRRELDKACCAFGSEEYQENLSAVSTGNWGCGAFGGDKHLKALIQMMAASYVGREVRFFTFGDERLCRELEHTHQALQKTCTVGQVMGLIRRYHEKFQFSKPTVALFEFICRALSQGWISADKSQHRRQQNSPDYKSETP